MNIYYNRYILRQHTALLFWLSVHVKAVRHEILMLNYLL